MQLLLLISNKIIWFDYFRTIWIWYLLFSIQTSSIDPFSNV